MSEQMAKYEAGLPVLADDTLIQIAKQAEARIDAVIKIKQIALKVTNVGDWCDQAGKPYLMASGSEKVANLFNVSWYFLTPEPIYEEETDGHYTFTYRARFELGSRFIEVEGSRSSRDGFFTQNEWKGQVKTAKDVKDRDNKRDVKMAALTNLLGNGITRILGIRNLTYDDLEKFAGIKKEQIGKVEYKKPEKQMQEPGEKKADNPMASEAQIKAIHAILTKKSPDSDHLVWVNECLGFIGKPEELEHVSIETITKEMANKIFDTYEALAWTKRATE